MGLRTGNEHGQRFSAAAWPIEGEGSVCLLCLGGVKCGLLRSLWI